MFNFLFQKPYYHVPHTFWCTPKLFYFFTCTAIHSMIDTDLPLIFTGEPSNSILAWLTCEYIQDQERLWEGLKVIHPPPLISVSVTNRTMCQQCLYSNLNCLIIYLWIRSQLIVLCSCLTAERRHQQHFVGPFALTTRHEALWHRGFPACMGWILRCVQNVS